jgi:ferric-dicitrate binding protein FerR (iron transport regulator)
MDMMPIGPPVEAGELDTEAVNWLVRSESSCTAEERARLEAWLASPRHRAAYLRMSAAWSQADQLRRLQPLDGRVNPDLLSAGAAPVLGRNAPPRSDAGRARAVRIGYLLIAAALTALVSGLTAWIVVMRAL